VSDPVALVDDLTSDPDYRGQLVHLERLPARPARLAEPPGDLPEVVRSRLAARGLEALWSHQAAAIALARAGRHVVVATGTASGKSTSPPPRPWPATSSAPSAPSPWPGSGRRPTTATPRRPTAR
jgi:hypothetical protein